MIARIRSLLSSRYARRWLRYSAVSLISLVFGQLALAIAFGLAGLAARPANLVAFVAGAIPSYALNRRWTWERSGRSHLVGEILPFGLLAVVGLVASTWAVGAAEAVAATSTDERAIRTAAVMAASLAAYGALWVVKFFAFDRVLFGRPPAATVADGPRTIAVIAGTRRDAGRRGSVDASGLSGPGA